MRLTENAKRIAICSGNTMKHSFEKLGDRKSKGFIPEFEGINIELPKTNKQDIILQLSGRKTHYVFRKIGKDIYECWIDTNILTN